MEGNASVYQLNPVSRISGEGRAGFLRTWGPDFDQKEAGRGEGGEGTGGYMFWFSSPVMVGVGIYTLGGEFLARTNIISTSYLIC